ncbi:MAG: four helix bundle protein [Candidatus Liptonbacteria bacterium]|nr:four helix bundle protein [Candidatus Liptonbacteria bacterium]
MESEKKFKNYRFENLEVYRIAMDIVKEIYKVTKKFPKDELFSLVNQLKRAATSIVLNIVEGSAQPTKKSFILYIRRSIGSTVECVGCVKIALQENFVLVEEVKTLQALLEKEYFKLLGLEKSLSASTFER